MKRLKGLLAVGTTATAKRTMMIIAVIMAAVVSITGSSAYAQGAGKALSLDGDRDFVSLVQNMIDMDNMTIELWASLSGGNEVRHIFMERLICRRRHATGC